MDEPRVETISTLIRGMDQGIDPYLLQQGQFAYGENISIRDGMAETRPSLVRVCDFQKGTYQGACLYRLNNEDRIIYGMDGHILSLSLKTLIITDHGLLLDPEVPFYFCQVDRYMVIQDGIGDTWATAHWPVILQGDTIYDQTALRASDPQKCVPKGSVMAYGHGRLFVVANFVWDILSGSWTVDIGRTSWVAGDIILANNTEAVLRFTETNYLSEGGAIMMPNELGFIRTMNFQRNAQTGTGIGSMIVMTENGCSAFNVGAPRAEWAGIDIAQVLFMDAGSKSPLSDIPVNNDIIFRGIKQIRSLRYSVTSISSESASLSNDGISREVKLTDSRADLPLVSGLFTDNRVLMTTDKEQGTFASLVSLDVSPVSSLGQPTPPIYNGYWTGKDMYGVVRGIYDGDERAFVLSPDGLYYFGEGVEEPNCKIHTRYFNYGAPEVEKQFDYADVWLADIDTDLTFTVYYRTDRYPNWAECHTMTLKGGGGEIRQRVRFTPKEVGTSNNRMLNRGVNHQYALVWKGQCKVIKASFISTPLTEIIPTFAFDVQKATLNSGTINTVES